MRSGGCPSCKRSSASLAEIVNASPSRAWCARLSVGEYVPRAADRRELIVKARQLDAVHEIGVVVDAVVAAALERRGRVLHHRDLEPEVGRHPGRRRHALVGGQAGQDEFLDAVAAQVRLEAGSDERAVDVLPEHRLAGGSASALIAFPGGSSRSGD